MLVEFHDADNNRWKKSLPQFKYGNCFLAGGYLRDEIFLSEPAHAKDIDIFCLTKEDQDRFIEENGLEKCIYENFRMKMFTHSVSVGSHKRHFPVQVIVREENSLEEIIRNFDFTFCQFAYDGETVYATPEGLIDASTGTLVYTGNQVNSVPQILRTLKFKERGFHLPKHTLKEMLKLASRLTEEEIENDSYLNRYVGQKNEKRNHLIEICLRI